MSKIGSDHLARQAMVYIRQSTADQVMRNLESQKRQYALADRARQLGWDTVQVIDDDLGRSGSGVARPGFEKLLAAICEGRVGAVVSIEASRLARNGRDWHTLLEFCGLAGTLIVDEDGVYDPRHPNDRLLLGMKGTMSEMELSMLRQRSQEALRQKARRGELFMTVAVGYVWVGKDRIDKDPDLRVQDCRATLALETDSVLAKRRNLAPQTRAADGDPRQRVEKMDRLATMNLNRQFRNHLLNARRHQGPLKTQIGVERNLALATTTTVIVRPPQVDVAHPHQQGLRNLLAAALYSPPAFKARRSGKRRVLAFQKRPVECRRTRKRVLPKLQLNRVEITARTR